MALFNGQQYAIDPVNAPYAAFAQGNDTPGKIGSGLTLGDMAKGNFGSSLGAMGGNFGNFAGANTNSKGFVGGVGDGGFIPGSGKAIDLNQPGVGAGAPTTGGYGSAPGQYSADQTAAIRKAIATPGFDYGSLLGMFGGSDAALRDAVQAHSSGGALYDPNAIAQFSQANIMGLRNPVGGASAQPGGGGVAPAASGATLGQMASGDFGNLAPGFDPNTPQGAGGIGSTTPGNMMGDAGGMANPTQMDTGANPFLPPGVAAPASTASPATAGPSLTEAPGNYTGGMTMADYANPMADWMTDEGLRKLKSSYAATGNFLSGGAMRGITDYAEKSAQANSFQPAYDNYMRDKAFNLGVDTNDRDFAANQANADRNFNYTVDTGNRNFDYTAKTGDRAFDEDVANRLAQLGLSGTTGAAGSNNTLALLLAQLAQSAGQAQGSGTIGSNNALTSAISQIIANLSQQGILNRVFPQGSGG